MLPGRDLYTRVPRVDEGWPTWDASDTSSGLRTGLGGYNAFDAAVGGWLAVTFWIAVNSTGVARYIVADGSGASRGFAFYKASNGVLFWRVMNGAGTNVDLSLGAPVVGRFNVVLVELDVAAGEIAGTLNNGARVTKTIVGHVPTDPAQDRLGVDIRQNLAGGLGTDGGVHALATAAQDVITATQRVTFWGSYARARGLGDFGQPPGGVETLGNPVAQRKYVAHDQACKVSGTQITKSGTVLDAFHPPVLAY